MSPSERSVKTTNRYQDAAPRAWGESSPRYVASPTHTSAAASTATAPAAAAAAAAAAATAPTGGSGSASAGNGSSMPVSDYERPPPYYYPGPA